ERVCGQLRICRGSQNGFDISQLPIIDVLLQKPNHSLLNVFADYLAGWSDNLGQPPHVVADTCADIRDDGTFLNSQSAKLPDWVFLLYAFRTREPVRARDTHYWCRLPADLRLRQCCGGEH